MPQNYDSDFCGSLPLNFINLTQPYGILLVTEAESMKIIQVSENVETYFSQPSSVFPGKPLDELIDASSFKLLKERMAGWKSRGGYGGKIPVSFTLSANGISVPFLAVMHLKDSQLLFELEKAENEQAFSFVYQEVKYIMSIMKNAGSIGEICQMAASEIKKLSGFDKVMIYRFDRDWNGEVVAEVREEDMDSYLGLRFPASDIPKQARELYFSNPYRFIPDRSYTPVRLHPVLNPLTFTYTDLSDCNMRSVAPVHLEYLKNMKVESSMSVPLILENRLWGLISCHHKTARFLHYEMRSAFELLANYVSAQLAAKESEQALMHGAQLQRVHGELYRYMTTAKDLVEGLTGKSPSLLDLLEADGAAVVFNDRVRTVGSTPPEAFIREVVYWLKINNIEKPYAIDSVQNILDPDARYKDTASGFIAIPVSVKQGDYIIGFRPELIQEVYWGGNPNDAIQFEEDQKTYHPRNSFSTWKETVKHTSAPWEPETIEAANNLRSSILEIIIRSSN